MYFFRVLKSSSKQRGVSLIELILVLAISGLLIVLALGGISGGKRTQFDDSMKQTLNGLRQLQNEATSGQGPSATECDNAHTSAAAASHDKYYKVDHGCLKVMDADDDDPLRLGDILLGRAAVLSVSPANNVQEGYDTSYEQPSGGPTQASVYNDGLSLSSIYGKHVASAYYQFQVSLDSNGYYGTEIIHSARSNVKLPSGLMFVGSQACNIDGSSCTDYEYAILVFAKLITNGAQTSNSALPYFFPAASFAESSVSPIAYSKSTYQSYPEPKLVRLNFISSANSKFAGTIEINTSTGSLEIAK